MWVWVCDCGFVLGGVCAVEVCGILCSNGGNSCVGIQINITLTQFQLITILNVGFIGN